MTTLRDIATWLGQAETARVSNTVITELATDSRRVQQPASVMMLTTTLPAGSLRCACIGPHHGPLSTARPW